MRSNAALRYRIKSVLDVPAVFELVESVAGLSRSELITIFNFGIGFAIFVRDANEAIQVCECATQLGLKALHAGQVERYEQREVVVEPWGITLQGQDFQLSKS